MSDSPESTAQPEPNNNQGSGPNPAEKQSGQHQSFWLFVMCLTGVDYFSTLGYLPAIAYEATGELSPIATVILVVVTLCGALPVYAYVARRSPYGMGSISLLERLVKGWPGKFLVLSLLGFVATAFIFTKTLSAADAAEHLVENSLLSYIPFLGHGEGMRLDMDLQRLGFTFIMLTILGATFLRGFREVIGLAVVIVCVFLVLNLLIIGSGIVYLIGNPAQFADWMNNLNDPNAWEIDVPFGITESSVLIILALCLFYFPKLALGLSGFETGLMVMPLIKSDTSNGKSPLGGRIINTRKLLITAAVIMSVLLLGSSFITATLIDPLAFKAKTKQEKKQVEEFVHLQGKKRNGEATKIELTTLAIQEGKISEFSELQTKKLNGQVTPAERDRLRKLEKDIPGLRMKGKARARALAYLAVNSSYDYNRMNINPFLFGRIFGTIYDLATVVILWFAGASAMAGLLNLVPQYLPRYGMAPEWAKALRPLILLFTAINLVVTWIFDANVLAQSGAYATGVLVFIFSGCSATLIDRWYSRPKSWGARRITWMISIVVFGLITVIFLYATIAIMINQIDGIIIATIVIVLIIVVSMCSRAARSTELRFTGFKFDNEQSRFLWDSLKLLEFPALVPHRPGTRDLKEKDEIIRKEHRLTQEVPVVFLEVELGDVSEFWQTPLISIIQEEGRFIIRVTRCASIAHTIAAIGLELSKHGEPPEIHFGWSDESAVAANLNFLLLGEGNVPWMVRSLIIKEQPDPEKQPRIIIG